MFWTLAIALPTCRGHLRDKLGDFEAAVADFSAILSQDPANINALFSRGFSRDNLGQTEAAVADYMRALELDQKD
jgi:Flp pilus assembly protein TadD